VVVLLDNRLLTAYVSSIAKRLGFTAQVVDTSVVDKPTCRPDSS